MSWGAIYSKSWFGEVNSVWGGIYPATADGSTLTIDITSLLCDSTTTTIDNTEY